MSLPLSKHGYPLIDEGSAHHVIKETMQDPRKGRGLVPRDFGLQPHGSLGFAAPFQLPLIPRSEWKDRIAAAERTKSRIPDLCDALGIPVKNQQQTNFCFANAPTHCVEIVRGIQGEQYVELSPASVACELTNFRNQGGWGTQALQYIVEHGISPVSEWPANAIDRRYDNPQSQAARQKYKITEWWDLKPRGFDEVATCVLLNIPVAIGLNWWGHEVTAVALSYEQGRFWLMIDNSWGTGWGHNGRGLLSESKGTPDDAVAPKVALAA